MPRKGRRTTRHSLSQPSTSARADEDESMEEEPRASTQPQESQDDPFESQAHADQVAHLVKYLLAADSSKTPVTKTAITKACGIQGRELRAALTTAHGVFENVFGYHLIEMDNKLMLCNTLTNEHFEDSDDTCERYALLFLVLSHIFMSGEKCGQASLCNFLGKLGFINDGNPVHENLGDVVKLVTEDFVKEKYIDKCKLDDSAGSDTEFKWGKRAEEELSVRAVMEFVSKVYGNKDLQSWQQQYECMIRKERAGIATVNGH